MFRNILIVLFVAAFASTAFAQWPPVQATPAPIMQGLHLPEGRFVPSTKRWNLVWADQIIPNNITAARLQFAATHYAATQKIWDYQVAQFRAINPNFLCVAYHLAAGLNPAHNDDCPDPKSQSGSAFIGSIAPKGYVSEYAEYFLPWVANHGLNNFEVELAFQHYDSIDISHRVWHNDPAWLMDLSSYAYQRYLGETTTDWMIGNHDDGCFFDVAVETNSSLYNPKLSDPSPYNFDWWHRPAAEAPLADRSAFATWQNARYLSCYQNIYKRLHSGDTNYLIIPNVDQMVTTVYDPTWMDGDASGETIDGAMMESFGGYREQDMWLSMERCVRHITGSGKILIAQFYDASQVERLRRTAMYMLVKNENSFLNILGADGVEWYPEYEIDLGDQSPLPGSLDSLRITGTDWHSLWARDYVNGRVLVNTSDAPMTLSLASDAEWAQVNTQGGGKIADDGTMPSYSITYQPLSGTITVPASSGIILKRTDLQSVKPDVAIFTSVTPNPATNRVTFDLNLPEATEIEVSMLNVIGERSVVYRGFSGSGRNSIGASIAQLPAGIYQCVVRTSTGKTSRLVVIAR